ncbi:hypothetical protein HZS_8038 [Henneguya salminicola]|nr:hypothetical protein HZS_8038 [Henneguya salminicola]
MDSTREELLMEIEYTKNNIDLKTRNSSKACEQIIKFTLKQEVSDPLVNKNIPSPYRVKQKRVDCNKYLYPFTYISYNVRQCRFSFLGTSLGKQSKFL